MSLNKAKLASELAGLGPGGGSLEKLVIRYKYEHGKSGKVEALFNPTEISISRSVSYEQKKVAGRHSGTFAVEQDLRSIDAATLSVELFFDTYESRDDSGSWKRAAAAALTPTNPFQSSDATDVTDLTDKVARLALPEKEKHQPPICSLRWGSFDIFTGVLTQLDQRFTMFLSDGTPVRATLSCTFVEYRTTGWSRAQEMHSSDVAKTHVVRRNDTLQSIAALHFEDPAQWRLIARANRIVNPRDVQPGVVLTIPRIRP